MLEVGVIHLPHDTAPSFFGVEQTPFIINIVGIEIIRAALGGVEREVEGLDYIRFSVGQFTPRKDFFGGYFAHIGIGLLFKVVFKISRRKR